MAKIEYIPSVHNDICIEDETVFREHKNLIKKEKYEDAATLLMENPQISGGVASILNSWEKTILELHEDFQSIGFKDPYIYSATEPASNTIGDRFLWQQEY